MKLGLFFFFLSVFVAQAQKDSVRLVNIQSSECGGMYYVQPHFLRKETVGDTTFITLSCSNNCSGYHDPSVSLSGDSVLIKVGYGERITRFKLLNGQYLEEEEINLHAKDSILEEVTESIAMCDCCFTFELKVLGLDTGENYNYFYNGKFIDPDYKAPRLRANVEYWRIFNEPGPKIFKKITKIVSSKKIRKLIEKDELIIHIKLDTITCSFTEIRSWCGENKTKNMRSAERKLNRYFRSLSPSCIIDPNKNQTIDQFVIAIDYLFGEWDMRYLPGEELDSVR